jgi:hypothetical protein
MAAQPARRGYPDTGAPVNDRNVAVILTDGRATHSQSQCVTVLTPVLLAQ